MEFVIKISQFLLSLSLLIVLHELGHFIPAKLFKTRVEKFYLFLRCQILFIQKENRRHRVRNWLAAFRGVCKDFWND